MKRWMSLLMLTALLLGALTARAEVCTALEGEITEVTDEGFLMEDKEQGTVYVLWDDETVWDGLAQKDTLTVGQYAFVQFDGRMTRSLPPQVVADRVGVYRLSGTVGALLDNGFLLEGDEMFGTVEVHGAEGLPDVYEGMPVTVYYNGVMAMSYPGQVNAAKLEVPALTGVVSGAAGEGFTLTPEGGEPRQISITAQTRVIGLVCDGETVTVLYAVEPEPGDALAACEVRVGEGENDAGDA